MKCIVFLLLIAAVVVQCSHTFLGTNVLRPLVYHHSAEYSAKIFQKRVENLHYSLPQQYLWEHRSIKADRKSRSRDIIGFQAAGDANAQTRRRLFVEKALSEGILAYDRKHSQASANITQGGIGFNFVNIRMKSERGQGLRYDIYIYA